MYFFMYYIETVTCLKFPDRSRNWHVVELISVCDICSSRLVDELSLEESYRYSMVDCDTLL